MKNIINKLSTKKLTEIFPRYYMQSNGVDRAKLRFPSPLKISFVHDQLASTINEETFIQDVLKQTLHNFEKILKICFLVYAYVLHMKKKMARLF